MVNKGQALYFPDALAGTAIPAITYFYKYNTLIEIKGLHFFKNHDKNNRMINPYIKNKTPEQIKLDNDFAEAKHKCMIQHNVIIITNYHKYIKYVNTKYGNNYLNNLKMR